MVPRHPCCVLYRLRCNGLSLLLSSYIFRIGKIENSFCSACGHLSSHSTLFSYKLFAPLTRWRLSVSLQPLVKALESFPASGASSSSTMPPSLGRGRVTTTTTAAHLVYHKRLNPPRADAFEILPSTCSRATSVCTKSISSFEYLFFVAIGLQSSV